MSCWKVLRVERLIVFKPLQARSAGQNRETFHSTYASVIALIVRKSEFVKLTLLGGVDEPQNIIAAIRHVKMKYA